VQWTNISKEGQFNLIGIRRGRYHITNFIDRELDSAVSIDCSKLVSDLNTFTDGRIGGIARGEYFRDPNAGRVFLKQQTER
jgi:hypothetical protein